MYWFLIISALLIFSTVVCKTESEAGANYDYDVIIMGAGMAGISAGHVLHAAKLKILIIEAQDYVGGRTKVRSFGGYSFNVGASWIEGYCPTFATNPKACAYNGHTPKYMNPMVTLAEKYNITHTDAGYFDFTMLEFLSPTSKENVSFANITEVNEVWTRRNKTQDCLVQLMKDMYDDWEWQDISYKTALYKCGWQPPLTPLEKTVEYIGFTFEYAEEAKYTSFLGSEQGVFEDFGKYSRFITDPRGYAGITLGLGGEYLNLQNISAEPKLIINSPITKIAYNYGSKVTVTIEPTDGTPKRTYNSKFGICTFPLGVFQSDIVEFDPPLSDAKRDAYLSETMAVYLAVLVQWPYNFWEKLGITTHVIDFIDNRDNYWMWAYNFDHPSFYPGSHIWRFDIITGDAHRVQGQSDKDTINELINQKLSHYFGEAILPQPIAIAHWDWSRNPYVQGMYSNWNMGMNWEKWAKMGEPFIEEGLYFAGEAISDYSGDVQGAYDIGINVAKAVIAANV
eukprot:76962_1